MMKGSVFIKSDLRTDSVGWC